MQLTMASFGPILESLCYSDLLEFFQNSRLLTPLSSAKFRPQKLSITHNMYVVGTDGCFLVFYKFTGQNFAGNIRSLSKFWSEKQMASSNLSINLKI